jgi:serine/threonine protein kinase
MKRVRGERLDDFARSEHSRPELLRVFLQVCDAVAFAHAAGVIHRDLKPQNIMLGPFGEVLVLDWGVARATSTGERSRNKLAASASELPLANAASECTAAAGTPGYMAPEQLDGAADERVDVFGLGGILFFLLTREHPSPSLTEWTGARDIPAPLRAICDRARAADPMSRYQSVADLSADVANYLDALPVTAHAEGIVERLQRIAVRHRTALLLVLAYLIMRVALLILARR